MLEYFQGKFDGETIDLLEPEKVYDLSDNLAKWLLENGKAVKDKEEHYGGQAEPELRADNKKRGKK